MDPVTAALVAGIAAGLTSTASASVRDAYEALKSALRTRFPRIDVAPLEELPSSLAKQASVAEDLERFHADRDVEVLRLAAALVEAVARDVPQVAARVGVDVERVQAEILEVLRIEGQVRVRDASATGRITIADVRAPRGPDPN